MKRENIEKMQAHVVDMAGTSSLWERIVDIDKEQKTKSKKKVEDKKKRKKEKYTVYLYKNRSTDVCISMGLSLSADVLHRGVDVQPSIASNEPAQQSSIFFFFLSFPYILFVPSSSIDVQFLQDCWL